MTFCREELSRSNVRAFPVVGAVEEVTDENFKVIVCAPLTSKDSDEQLIDFVHECSDLPIISPIQKIASPILTAKRVIGRPTTSQ